MSNLDEIKRIEDNQSITPFSQELFKRTLAEIRNKTDSSIELFLEKKKVLFIVGDEGICELISKKINKSFKQIQLTTDDYYPDYSLDKIISDIIDFQYNLIILQNSCRAFYNFFKDYIEIKRLFPSLKILVLTGAPEEFYNKVFISPDREKYDIDILMKIPSELIELEDNISFILGINKTK